MAIRIVAVGEPGHDLAEDLHVGGFPRGPEFVEPQPVMAAFLASVDEPDPREVAQVPVRAGHHEAGRECGSGRRGITFPFAVLFTVPFAVLFVAPLAARRDVGVRVPPPRPLVAAAVGADRQPALVVAGRVAADGARQRSLAVAG